MQRHEWLCVVDLIYMQMSHQAQVAFTRVTPDVFVFMCCCVFCFRDTDMMDLSSFIITAA